MGNCCKRKGDNLEGSKLFGDKNMKDFKLDRSTFQMHIDKKFKDDYLIGKSMGTGINGEVR